MQSMLARAEEFDSSEEASRRYYELGRMLKDHGESEAALLNCIVEDRFVVMLLGDVSIRRWSHEGSPGRLVDLPSVYWEALINRHERKRTEGLGFQEIHHERPLPLSLDGTDRAEDEGT